MSKNMHQNSLNNLKPFQSLTKEEIREIVKKGVKARVERNRQRKSMRELMNILLSLPVGEKTKLKMEKMGITKTIDQNNKMLVAVGLLKRAKTGDPRAVEVLCGISGDIYSIPKDMEDENTKEQQINDLKDFEIKIIDASKDGGENV